MVVASQFGWSSRLAFFARKKSEEEIRRSNQRRDDPGRYLIWKIDDPPDPVCGYHQRRTDKCGCQHSFCPPPDTAFRAGCSAIRPTKLSGPINRVEAAATTAHNSRIATRVRAGDFLAKRKNAQATRKGRRDREADRQHRRTVPRPSPQPAPTLCNLEAPRFCRLLPPGQWQVRSALGRLAVR